MDWHTEIGGTPELLACVPGLSEKTLRAWQLRGHILPRGQGTGRPVRWRALDVLELAFKHELAAWLPLSDCSLASACIDKALAYHAEGKTVALALSRNADGHLVAQLIDEEADDAPTAMLFLVLRVSSFIDRTAARIAHVQANPVR